MEQFEIIRKLMARQSIIVISTDYGREGEIIGRELCWIFFFDGSWKIDINVAKEETAVTTVAVDVNYL